MLVAVAGASGFIGRHLVPALVEAGHEVRALTRDPQRYRGSGTPRFADVDDPDSLPAALAGAEVLYYLVHSLDHRDFVRRDAAAAAAVGQVAAELGVRRIVYLGGLGDPTTRLSRHLRSRQDVERLLADGGVPVTTLRAGVVIGHGSTSWALIRRLVELVPLLVVPTWADTRTQPIALADVVRYLVGVLQVPETAGAVYEIGGAEVLRYRDLLSRLSRIEGRPPLQLRVPMPSVRLSAVAAARTLPLLTGVDAHTVRALVESMPHEVVVRDEAIRELVPFTPMDYDAAVLAALAARAAARRSGEPEPVPIANG